MIHIFPSIILLISITLAATKQLCEWFGPSVTLSVRLSHFFTKFPSLYHHEIFRSYYQCQTWCPCKRSRSEIKGQGLRAQTQLSRFRTVTPVWIPIWRRNHAQSLMLLRRGAVIFLKSSVKFRGRTAKESSIVTQFGRFRTLTPVGIHQWLHNDTKSLKKHRRGALMFFKVICQISRSRGTKNHQFWPKLGVPGL